jgi:probable F420-dependent oxidoreductase
MQFGLYLGSAVTGRNVDPDRIRALTRASEALDFHSVWVPDHVVIPTETRSPYPYAEPGAPLDPLNLEVTYDPLATLPYLAGLTTRIKLGVAVLVVPYRNPLIVAKWLASLDQLSGGRLLIGVGVGWLAEEFTALGQPHFAHRGLVTDEYLTIWKTLWSDRPAEFAGRFYGFGPVLAGPKPLQAPHPPIYVGGNSPAALRRAARFGSAWLLTRLGPAEVATRAAALRRLMTESGRSPDDVLVSVRVALDFGDRNAAPALPGWQITGDTAAVVAACRRYEAAGVSLLIPTLRPDAPLEMQLQTLDRLARDVVPAFGGGR